MNSLNILSSRVIGQTNPTSNRPRSRSQGELFSGQAKDGFPRGRSKSEYHIANLNEQASDPQNITLEKTEEPEEIEAENAVAPFDEKSPLLQANKDTGQPLSQSRLLYLVKRIANALSEGLRLVFSAIGAPFTYVAARFRDDTGRLSPVVPLKKLRKRNPSGTSTTGTSTLSKATSKKAGQPSEKQSMRRQLRSSSSSESISSTTSESDSGRRKTRSETPSHRTRSSKSSSSRSSADEVAPSRRSIRIKLNNEGVKNKRRESRNRPNTVASSAPPPGDTSNLTVNNIKSPTSTHTSPSKLTKYPHAPSPPRPLVPRRQPSYAALNARSSSRTHHHHPTKTLVLDLDETLIHSLAKGGRMSSGHMVEVKLNAPIGIGNQTLGPQHPILYYVHKRPYCDDFLRKVCKWYKLVIFTASVQEYADPVIDWLEQERKFFSARLYRQHCTYRNGAYIKDLGSVEPDLSKVLILDNSPMSYMFHEDNAIPIEGWINDPTDNDLLHLLPMLEALQHVTDVRAFLALRRGEADS
ncbi:MAG: hypothetical protein Q9160_004017 [Pyrenula sp. 1 TL-2023]